MPLFLSNLYLYLKSHRFIILILIYLLFRLPFLTRLPVFSDEALYIEWGWRAIHYPGQLFHALHDAKQPLLMWFFGIGQTIFPDTLWGSRIVSVSTGFLSLWGIYLITKKISGPKAAFISGLVYTVIPFFTFFDRQALMESAIIACSVWTFYYLLKLNENPNLKNALIIGTILGLGFFVKTTAIIFLLSFVIIELIIAFKNKNSRVKIITLLIYSLLAFFTVISPLLFQPGYWKTLDTNSRWSYTPAEILKFPVSQWFTNIIGNNELAFLHLTPPVYLFVLIGLWSILKNKSSSNTLFLFWLFLPAAFYLVTQKFMNYMIFRYITPFLPLTLIPASQIISRRPKLLLPLLFLPAAVSWLLITNPVSLFHLQNRVTKYSYIEGYVTGVDTGFEVNEIVNYFKNISAVEPIYLTIAVHSFNPESGIWNNFRKDKHVTVSYFDSLLMDKADLAKIDCLATDRPFYFVAKLNDTAGLDKFFDFVTVITNSQNKDYVTVYTLKKNCVGNTFTFSLSNPINH